MMSLCEEVVVFSNSTTLAMCELGRWLLRKSSSDHRERGEE